MPSPAEILEGLASIAHRAFPVAAGWHLVLLAALVAWLAGVRPTRRLTGALLAMPFLSVGFLAFVSGNPFNGAAFVALSAVLVLLSLRFARASALVAADWSSALGWAMVVFAWVYPHFLDDWPAITYLIGAPMGVVPCPTLSLVVGVSMLFRGIEGRVWSLIVGGAGLVYGLVGAVVLGVRLDLGLVAGSATLLALVLRPGSALQGSEETTSRASMQQRNPVE